MSRDTKRIAALEARVSDIDSDLGRTVEIVATHHSDLANLRQRVTALESPEPTPEPEPQPEPPPDASPLERIFGCPQGPRPHAEYDAIFAEWGDHHWNLHPGDNFAYGYYDRTLVWYAAWWRGLGDEYLTRAAKEADAYLTQYVIPNDYKIPPRWVFVEGLAVHYLVTGDERALTAIKGMADRLWSVWGHQLITTQYLDGRVQGRTVLAQIIAYELTGLFHCRERATVGIDLLADWFLSENTGKWAMTSYGNGQANFQVAHAVLYSVTRFADLIDAINIQHLVDTSLEWMWQHWDGIAFPYVSDPIDNTDGHNTGPAPDLNLLIAPAFQWAGQTDRVQQIVDAGLEHTWWNGYKQFNQSFMRSWLCL